VTSSLPLARRETQQLDYKPYYLSWWRDGSADVHFRKTMNAAVLSKNESEKILEILNSLINLYPTLSPANQHLVATRIMDVTPKLLETNLHFATDTLFWEVFRSIDLAWLEDSQIEAALGANNSFYFQTWDLSRSEKILLKITEIQDFFDGNMASQVNIRTVLGDLYDLMDKPEQAKQQYEIANAINEKLVHDGFLDGSSDLFYLQTANELKMRLSPAPEFIGPIAPEPMENACTRGWRSLPNAPEAKR